MVVDSEWYEPASNSTEDIEAAERTMLFTVSNTSSLMIYLNLFDWLVWLVCPSHCLR